MEFINPDNTTLNRITNNARDLIIVSPFYSVSGFRLLKSSLSSRVRKLILVCRLNVNDWLHGSIDPPALIDFMKNDQIKGVISIKESDYLHAKIYLSETGALIGSANLTSSGFGSGIELLAYFDTSYVSKINRFVSNEIFRNVKDTSPASVFRFVRENRSYVDDAKKKLRKTSNELMRRSRKKKPLSSLQNYSEFLDYCAKLSDSAANEVWERAFGKDQLSGHIKRLFYASWQFLENSSVDQKSLSNKNPENFRIQHDSLMLRTCERITGIKIYMLASYRAML